MNPIQVNIYDVPQDGVCFKLQIQYTDYEDTSSFEPYLKWFDCFEDAINHGSEFVKQQDELGRYILDFRIQDDSK